MLCFVSQNNGVPYRERNVRLSKWKCRSLGLKKSKSTVKTRNIGTSVAFSAHC